MYIVHSCCPAPTLSFLFRSSISSPSSLQVCFPCWCLLALFCDSLILIRPICVSGVWNCLKFEIGRAQPWVHTWKQWLFLLQNPSIGNNSSGGGGRAYESYLAHYWLLTGPVLRKQSELLRDHVCNGCVVPWREHFAPCTPSLCLPALIFFLLSFLWCFRCLRVNVISVLLASVFSTVNSFESLPSPSFSGCVGCWPWDGSLIISEGREHVHLVDNFMLIIKTTPAHSMLKPGMNVTLTNRQKMSYISNSTLEQPYFHLALKIFSDLLGDLVARIIYSGESILPSEFYPYAVLILFYSVPSWMRSLSFYLNASWALHFPSEETNLEWLWQMKKDIESSPTKHQRIKQC